MAAAIAAHNRQQARSQNQHDREASLTGAAHGERVIVFVQRGRHVLYLLHSFASCPAWSQAMSEAVRVRVVRVERVSQAAVAAVSGPRQSTRYRSYDTRTREAEPL